MKYLNNLLIFISLELKRKIIEADDDAREDEVIKKPKLMGSFEDNNEDASLTRVVTRLSQNMQAMENDEIVPQKALNTVQSRSTRIRIPSSQLKSTLIDIPKNLNMSEALYIINESNSMRAEHAPSKLFIKTHYEELLRLKEEAFNRFWMKYMASQNTRDKIELPLPVITPDFRELLKTFENHRKEKFQVTYV